MERNEYKEIILKHFLEAFDSAMLEIETTEGCRTGDCDPWTEHSIDCEIENAAKILVPYAKYIVAANK